MEKIPKKFVYFIFTIKNKYDIMNYKNISLLVYPIHNKRFLRLIFRVFCALKEVERLMSNTNENKTKGGHKALTIIGVVLCIILIPILVINVTLIIRSYTNADEVPNIGGYSPLIVLSGSMEPEIKSGDIIICKQIDSNQVKVNDVIAFFDPDSNSNSVLTHRVVELVEENGSLYFRTKGDANNTEDRTLVPADNLVGIYQFAVPKAGDIAMFMQTPTGLIICVVVPLALLIGYDLFRRKRYEKKNQQDTDALLAELNELKAQKAAEQEKTPTDGQSDDQ